MPAGKIDFGEFALTRESGRGADSALDARSRPGRVGSPGQCSSRGLVAPEGEGQASGSSWSNSASNASTCCSFPQSQARSAPPKPSPPQSTMEEQERPAAYEEHENVAYEVEESTTFCIKDKRGQKQCPENRPFPLKDESAHQASCQHATQTGYRGHDVQRSGVTNHCDTRGSRSRRSVRPRQRCAAACCALSMPNFW